MRSFANTSVITFILLAVSSAPAFAVTATLTDNQLVSRAAAALHVQRPPADRILGIHRGVQVIVDDRCGDGCPANTVRIIRYMIGPGPACSRIGGDSASIGVPITVGITMQTFCVPHILYRRNLYTSRPYHK